VSLVVVDDKGHADFFITDQIEVLSRQFKMIKFCETNSVPNCIKQYMRDEIIISTNETHKKTPIIFSYSHNSFWSRIKRWLFKYYYSFQSKKFPNILEGRLLQFLKQKEKESWDDNSKFFYYYKRNRGVIEITAEKLDLLKQ
jgi:hypothetical protein